MGYFSSDPQCNRAAIGRTLAVFRQIKEIDEETTTGEAFRKYVRKFIDETEKAMAAEPTE